MKTSISFSSLSPNKRRSPSTPSLTSLRRSQSIVAELEELMSDENVPNADDVSLTQLNHYAVTLAGLHRITSKKDRPALIKRLDENVFVLNQAYDIINDAIMSGRRITSSDEWLVDNFWMITEQIHMAKKHLPARYSEEMPRLENTAVAGLPRIYGLVLELINLVNGQITEENIFQFVKSYQSKKQLALGELWGIPIMLRLGLLENIRHVADDIIARREDCNAADAWADKLLQAADTSSKSVVEVLFQMSQSDPKITNSFVVQITQRLQGSNPLLSVINTWIEQQVSNKGLDVDQICRSQRHTNYVNQISIRNSITSLRFVNTHSWKDFVEQLSVTESILKQDPSGIYTLQDFDTRDACRHQVERLAHHNKIPEQEIAQAVLKMCNRVQSETSSSSNNNNTAVNKNFNYKTDQRQTHVGYWLLNPEGLQKLRENMHYKIGWREKLKKKIGVDTLSIFLGSITLITLLFVFIVLGLISEYDESFSWTGKWTLMLIACLTLVGSQLAVSLTNYIVVHL